MDFNKSLDWVRWAKLEETDNFEEVIASEAISKSELIISMDPSEVGYDKKVAYLSGAVNGLYYVLRQLEDIRESKDDE